MRASETERVPEQVGAGLISFAFALLLFAILRGPVIFWQMEGRGLVPSGTYLSIFAVFILLLGLFLRRMRSESAYVSALGFAGVLPILFFSDWMCHRYSFFQAPSVRGELLCGLMFAWLLIRKNTTTLYVAWPLITTLILGANFFAEADGRVIFSDDHASVFYRLSLLSSHFPWIPTYDTFWNAGNDARDFFSTGILNLFLIFSPLIKLFPLVEVYNTLVASVLFLLLPLSTYVSSRLLGSEKKTAAIAAALSMMSTLAWYKWALKYGSMGFVTSATLVPLNFAFTLRMLRREHAPSWIELSAFLLTFTLMIFWTPTGLIFVPALLLALVRAKELFGKPRISQFLCGVLLLNLPWMLVWISVANVFGFVGAKHFSGSYQENFEIEEARESSKEHDSSKNRNTQTDRRKGKGQSKHFDRASIVKALRSFGLNANPLLIFLGLPGLFFIQGARDRRLWFATSGWLLFMGLVLSPLKPQLELERMLVILALLLSFPTALAFKKLLDRAAGSGPAVQFVIACAASFFLVGAAVSSGILRNRSLEVYYFTDSTVGEMSQAITEHGGSGRVLFSGFVLHELDHGHIAPLAYYSQRPIIASSPVHNTWWYTDVIPEYYRDGGPAEIERYFDMMNVSAVFAHEPFWRNYFASQPSAYRLVWEGSRFKMFERLSHQGDYFFSGAGKIISQSGDGLVFEPSTSSGVLKFRYHSFLEAEGCKLLPHELPGDVTLTRFEGCSVGASITIRAKSGLSRVFS